MPVPGADGHDSEVSDFPAGGGEGGQVVSLRPQVGSSWAWRLSGTSRSDAGKAGAGAGALCDLTNL